MMASADIGEELNCSVCLNIYQDPVTLSCGHNFCGNCIETIWNGQDLKGIYTCPDCRKLFEERPKLQRNWKLSNVAKCYLSTQTKPEEAAVFCTYCLDSPSKAVKLCMQCEIALCEIHLCKHNAAVNHVLLEPTISLESRRCSVHKELLKYYCTKDDSFLCVSCCVIGQHKDHKVHLLSEAAEKKKVEMQDELQKVTAQSEENQRNIEKCQGYRGTLSEEVVNFKANITALFSDIRELLVTKENHVLERLSTEEASVLLKISTEIQELENRNTAFLEKMVNLQQLCALQDPLTVLRECKPSDVKTDLGRLSDSSSDISDDGSSFEEDAEYADTDDSEDMVVDERDNENVKAIDKELILVTLQNSLNSFVEMVTELKANRGFYVQGAAHITLDANTASLKWGLFVSQDLKTFHHSKETRSLRSSARFETYCQVMSSMSFSSGQNYWEVETTKEGDWSVGVSYPSIERHGNVSFFGYNVKSWCLNLHLGKLTAMHDGEDYFIESVSALQRVGLYLDYEGGVLSFYHVSEDLVKHLHTFTASFKEPLHPAFYVNVGAKIKIRRLHC